MQQLPVSGRTPNGSVSTSQMPVGSVGAGSVNTVTPSIQIEGAYLGSVANGSANQRPISLTLQDAIKRGIQYNLGAIGAGEAARQTRAQRLAAAAQMLPDIFGDVRESVQKINLAAEGFRITAPIPGFQFPTVIGPFNNFDARASVSESLSFTSLRNWQSSRELARSADLSLQDSRELVTLAVAGTYLQITASAARIQTAKTQLDTAQVVYQQAVDRNKSGLSARIDVNRSLVEFQSQQQRLTSLTNEYEKQKLALARLIGLPLAQALTLADTVPYRELPQPNVDDLVQTAFANRADVLAAAAQQKAAELSKAAASAEYLPALELNGDYGVLGVTPTNQAHGTYTAAGGVRVPIFRSGRIRADIEQADAALAQRKAEYQDSKGRAEQDVRVAALDLVAASQLVKVAESNRALASDTLEQARDRFRSGVADTIELVQAQESVATAEQDYISAVFASNLAQVSLARATGQTEKGIATLLQGK
uniref:Outer membrane efflux protein n=1 Tax=uncultured bacterium CSLG7 TaxID=1091577 RepID=G4WV47_9BACT|nr:outer membrane efflux protein [uncultured bacterium CSLG7]